LKKQDFERFEAVQYWMNSLGGRDTVGSSKYQWKLRLRKFCEWLGKTPDELIFERKSDLKSDDDRIRHRAEMVVKKYLRVLEDNGLSPNTIRTYFAAIRSFYQRNYAELKFFRRDAPKVITVAEGAKAANQEEIRGMIEVSKPRTKALILFLKDTGLSISDTSKLILKNLGFDSVNEIFEAEAPISLITNRQKTQMPVVTFVGREALDAIKTTLRLRQRGSAELKIRRYGRDEIKGGIPPEELTLESPLFRSYGKFLKTLRKPRIDLLKPNSISVLIRKAAIQAGIWKKGFSAHALRRYFQTSLESAGINRNWIKLMMGHKLEGVEGSYSQPQVEQLREVYVRAYPKLAINEVTEQLSRVESLEAEVEKLTINGKKRDESLQGVLQLMNMIKVSLESSETDRDKIGLVDDLKKLLLKEKS
jgi:integrase